MCLVLCVEDCDGFLDFAEFMKCLSPVMKLPQAILARSMPAMRNEDVPLHSPTHHRLFFDKLFVFYLYCICILFLFYFYSISILFVFYLYFAEFIKYLSPVMKLPQSMLSPLVAQSMLSPLAVQSMLSPLAVQSMLSPFAAQSMLSQPFVAQSMLS